MSISTVGRYAVLVQLYLSWGDLVARAAPSSFRGVFAGEVNVDDNDNLRRHHRTLQVCSDFKNRNQCTAAGCDWVNRSCIPAAPPPTNPPATPAPTPPPTPPPTAPPLTPSPTAPPSPSPTAGPAAEGMGYCSDDAGAQCWSKADCACGVASASSTEESLFGRRVRRARALQSACGSASKRKTCLEISDCAWVDGTCVSTTSQPTDPPVTSVPSKFPTKFPTSSPVTNQPTRAPTPCACLGLGPTKPPTTEPTTAPSSFPTKSPTYQPTPEAPSKSPTDAPSSSPNGSIINGEVGVPIIPDPSKTLIVALPPSLPGVLMTLSQVSSDNDDAVPIARSYDSRDFETLHPLLLPVNCNVGSCTVDIPAYPGGAAVHYIIRQYTPPQKTNGQDFARLLLQGTYGPTEASLLEASDIGSAAGWVRDQMDKSATLLRAHYRERANGYLKNDLRHMGTLQACEAGSRWSRHAFNRWRDIGKTIIEEPTGTGSYFLKVDGVMRTEVSTRPSVEFNLPWTSYVICRNTTVDENWVRTMRMSSFAEAPTGEKGTLLVAASADQCVNYEFIAINMPSVFFNNQANVPSVNLVSMPDPNIIEAKLLQDTASSSCDDFKLTWPNFVRDTTSGLYYVEDRRAELIDNTDGFNTQKKRMLDGHCPQVSKTFLNKDTCAIRSDCSTPVFSGDFDLNAQNLRAFYEVDGKIVYRIQNLPLVNTASPCATVNNRFVRKDAGGDSGGCDSNAEYPTIESAIEIILLGLTPSEQESKRVIDILDTGLDCTDPNDDALGASFTVTIPGSSSLSCWTHTYDREWSVFVMNDWAVLHPGNPRFYRESKPNPIADIAERENAGDLEDSVTLDFPPWGFHQYNFANNRWRFDGEHVGNWGDRISFNDLPDSARSANVVTHLGGTIVADSGAVIEVCGSPGEVGNNPGYGSQYLLQKFGDADEEMPDTLDQDHDRWHSSQMIWNTVTLNAPDQLRHRVAWALASIFVVTQNDIALEDAAEPWANYYDIFVRFAFGSSFFDLLKAVAFSPLMGMMLTFEGSKSLAYQIERNGASLYPDENFAREIMQLFSIGLYMLNQDGTKIIVDGQAVPTYTNDDIMNFSRGWTNFFIREENRDNVEPEWSHGWVTNRVDPMTLPTSEGRDVFPKQTLLVDGKRGYIGDQIPRCDTMPDKAWLRKGAIWEFRENSQSLMGKQDPGWWADPDTWTPRMILDPNTSSLYAKLCNFNGQECNFKSTVVLDEDIPCDGVCTAGQSTWDSIASPSMPCECSIDEPRTVRIDHSPTSAPVWYEYKRAPCIQMAYPESGNLNSVKEIGASGYGNKAMCADSRYAVAGTTCCDAGGIPINICVFKGERTTYQTAIDRCEAYGIGYSTCSWDTVEINWSCGTDTAYYQGDYSIQSSSGMRFSWTSEPCYMSAQIDRNGNVAIVHSLESSSVKERVGAGTGTYFGALWEGNGTYPLADTNCDTIPSCVVAGDTCLCEATTATTPVFDGSTPPTLNDLRSQLHIGANDPNLFDEGHYNLCSAPLCASQTYNIFSQTLVDSDTNFASAFNEETIFEVTNALGSPLFLSNTYSSVHIGGGYGFRNPPMYNSPVDPTQRDGLFETDDILQVYANHPNTAPFIATRLINHLVSSNPSPRYVKVVADAFRTGFYSGDGIAFGSGGYGDLEAAVAAIMLDSEARSAALDDDSNHGRPREPLLKIMHMYRSMQLSTTSGANRELDMVYLTARGIGQEAFNSPSVFSFFLSEYQPVGPVLNKGLVAPEAQLFDAPKLIGFVNGLFSLPIFGLTDCKWWQGFGETRARYWLTDYPEGGYMHCEGNPGAFENPGVPLRLNWKPPSWGGDTNMNGATTSSVLDDIDLLLTGGRLHSSNRALLEQVYNDALTGSDPDNNALKAVIQHYSAVPEYHITNNLVDSSSTTGIRDVPNVTIPQDPPSVEGYKSIVYLFMAGASDSYSMLAPIAACTALHTQYLNVRGDVAIQSGDLLQIDASTSDQPCNDFGLHPSLVNIHQLYGEGDAAWVSNIGPLVEPMNKTEFDAGSKPVPQALFAHNTQTQVTQAVFAQDGSAGGVLGRIGDALNFQEGEEIFSGYSISGTPKILEGAPGVSRQPDVLSGYGVASFNPTVYSYESNVEALSQNVVTSIHGETFSASMTYAIYRMRLLDGVVGTTEVVNDDCFDNLDTDIANQFWQVARLMSNRDGFEAKRDVFYTQIGGFDTHSDNGPALTALLKQIDDAIGCFKLEMDEQNIWNNVTIVSASEFGRTLTSNGLGTDHAWGGNHFILGGSVKGGIIHGQFPDDLTDQGTLNIGRGRLIPTTPWEGVWNGIAEWFGVTSQNIASVLPNRQNFESNIFSKADLFK